MTLTSSVHCTYCGEPVLAGVVHAESCPMTTGLFPVRGEDWPHGLRCMACRGELREGDSYVQMAMEDLTGHPLMIRGLPIVIQPVGEHWEVCVICCVGCGAQVVANA